MKASSASNFPSYLYDPLDRIIIAHSRQRFYNGSRIATEIEGHEQLSFFEHKSMPLAQIKLDAAVSLLVTDQQASVLYGISPVVTRIQSYCPFGNLSQKIEPLPCLGFNGEQVDPLTGNYLLGSGYRAYNPILMRFNSPDQLSPFGKGGINAYTYCSNDPVNFIDPTGHSRALINLLKKYRPAARIPRPNLVVKKPKIPDDGYVHVGFHGTSERHTESLLGGLKKSYAGSENGQTDGVGFYATPDYSFAHSFAREVVKNESMHLKRSTIFPFENLSRDPIVRSTPANSIPNQPVVFGVYVKGYQFKKPGLDFNFVRGGEDPLKSSELVFPISMYDDIIIRRLSFRGDPPLPWTANLNIRKS